MSKIIRNGVPYSVGTVEKIIIPSTPIVGSIVEWINPDNESPFITTINCIDSDDKEHTYYFEDGSVITVKHLPDIQNCTRHIYFNVLDSDGKTIGIPDPKSMKKCIKGQIIHGDKILYTIKESTNKIPTVSFMKF